MSELTICNRCSLDRMEELAAARGVVVITHVEDPLSDMAGWISARYSDHEKPSAWFMQLPARCAC